MKHDSLAVIGIGFGDEAKGLVTSNLAFKSEGRTLGVRYSGGTQASHRVVSKNMTFEHIFSSICSAVAFGADSYWSKYCVLNPAALVSEHKKLSDKLDNKFKCLIHGKSPITTVLDRTFNQQNQKDLEHGTCGWGVGQTIEREENHISLLFEDIFYREPLNIKLGIIYDYYKKLLGEDKIDITRNEFIYSEKYIYKELLELSEVKLVYGIPEEYHNIIFEGSQGLLLDQNNGFFPHATRANVGSKNILEMGYKPELYLVTRAYQTRHGNGPITNLNKSNAIILHDGEKNINNQFQGEFKYSILDLDLLKYAINKDEYIRNSDVKKTLIITCIDDIFRYEYTIDGIVHSHNTVNEFVNGIKEYLNIKNVKISSDEYSENLEII